MTAAGRHAPPGDALARLWRRMLRQQRFELRLADGTRIADVAALDRAVAAIARRWEAAGAGCGEVLMQRTAQGLPALLGFWAAQRLGLLWLPVDPAWPPARLAVLAERAGARWWIDSEAAPNTDSALSPPAGLRPLPAALDLDDAAAEPASSALPWPQRSGDAIAALLPTSGSTGIPKLVALSRAALARSAVLAVRSFGWQPGERLLNLAEPHTMSGLRNALLAAPLAGMHWLVSPPASRPDLFALLEQIRDRRPQRLVAAPLLIRQANLWHSRLPADTWTGLRALYCTGADLDRREVQRFHAREAIPVINYYGLTETVGLCLRQPLTGWDAQDDSLGTAVGCRIRLADEQGQPLPAGAGPDAIGELQVRQRRPSAGYWQQGALSPGPFAADGWLGSGDLARIAADGRVWLLGRRSHFIKTAGTEKVAPAEVEQALEAHPAVLEAAVLGVDGGAGVERIAALLVPRAPVAAHDLALQGALIAHVASLLGSARAPSLIRFVDHLPRAASGKLLRAELPALLEP